MNIELDQTTIDLASTHGVDIDTVIKAAIADAIEAAVIRGISERANIERREALAEVGVEVAKLRQVADRAAPDEPVRPIGDQ